MKRRFLVLLTTLFAILSISLTIIQVSQTRRAAKVSNNLFSMNVCNAVEDVCAQFDQMKVEDFVTQKERYHILQLRRIDELNEKMQDLLRDNSELFYDEHRIRFGISTQDSAVARPGIHLHEDEKAVLAQYNTLLNARNRLLARNASASHSRHSGTLSPRIDVTKLNYPLLDSLLREELIIKCGEDLHPAIGLLLTDGDTLLYLSDPDAADDLRKSAFKYSFEPNGLAVGSSLFILLDFPASTHILTDDTRFINAFSIALIVLITFLFAFSIRALWVQRKLDEMKTDFINNMTHEIKTPIATISLACEMLRDETVSCDAGQRRNFLNIISDENRRMRVLIETLLQSAKMSSKRVSLNLTELDLCQVAADAAESFHLTMENRHGTLVTDLQPVTGTLYADELHLTNMLHNLIDNAIKYSSSEPYVRVSTASEQDYAVLRVEDHGIGIAKQDQAHIFEKFYRVSTGDVHDVKGFGIGLNYVSQVVALHHGRISLDSTPGQGTTFTIQLPVV